MNKCCRWMAGFLAVVMAMSPSVFAQTHNADNGAFRENLQARMEEAQQLAAIEADKAGYVGELLARFASMAGEKENDTFISKGTKRLMRRSALELRQLSEQAKDFDTFRKLAFEGFTMDAFGQLTQDLVFFPIAACRIYDSRTATAVGLGGPMTPGTQRSVSVNDSTATQGGANPACNVAVPDLNDDPPAFAITLTAASPTGPGNLRTFAEGAAVPLAAMLTYTAGTTISTGTITASNATGLSSTEMTVRNQGAGNTDVVIDIVGYFHAPVAQPLSCATLSSVTAAATNTSFNATSPVCAAGFTLTGGGFDVNLGSTPDNDWFRSAPNAGNTAWECQGINATAFNVNITCFARCCQIPGR